MKKISIRCINFLLHLLPRFLEDKIRLFLHLMTGDWCIPPAYPHSCNFHGKISGNWMQILSDVDDESIAEIKEFFHRIETDQLLWHSDKRLRAIVCSDFVSKHIITPPKSEELSKIQKKLHLHGGFESLIAHHGVAFLPNKVKAHFKGKGIVDAGAFVGNYAIPYILNYCPAKVFAIEPNAGSIKLFKQNLKKNHIGDDIVKIFNCAVGSENKTIYFDDSGVRMDVAGNCKTALCTLDNLLLTENVEIGLIKADIEGMGTEMLAGAGKLIERDHPVLALSCYHTPEELFGQYIFLKNEFPFYHISFTALPPKSGWELTLIAVPRELL